MDALNRNQRNILWSRGAIVERQGEGSHQFDIDMFDVPEANCTGKDWGEEIDSWDIVAHDLDDADCGAHYDGFRCLCRAYFSLGAIMGTPHYTCQPC